MKTDNKPANSKKEKSEPGSNPVNQFKKGSKGATLASVDGIITGAVENVKAASGKGLTNEGSNVDYNEER